jgi:type VI secretion system protein ImpF
MAERFDEYTRITLSLVDRLSQEPDLTHDHSPVRTQSALRRFESSVAEDLQNLLNSRQEEIEPLADEFVDLNRSLLFYGLPDFTTYNLFNPADVNRLRRSIENTISYFEPRLQKVRVSMEPPKPNDRAVRFRIEAILRVEPAPSPVVFDTVLQLGTREYQVKTSG